MSRTGPSLLLEHAATVAAVAALLALSAGTGVRLLDRLRWRLDEPLEDLVAGTAVGAGVLATLLLALGLTAGLGPLPLVALGLAVVALAWPGLRALGPLVRAAAPRSRDTESVLALLGLVVLGGTLLLLALPPTTDWDSLAYHLTVPAEWVRDGRISQPEDNLHTAFVGVVHLLYVPLFALGLERAPAVLNAGFAWLLGVSVYAFARRWFGRRAGVASLWLVWSSAILLLVAATPRVDVSLAWFLFLAHAVLIRAALEPAKRSFFLLSALLLGLGVGVKFFALPFALALGPVAVWAAHKQAGTDRRRILPLLAAYTAVASVAVTPWLFKNILLLGAPFYPLLARELVEPWLGELQGSPYMPTTLQHDVARHLETIRTPFNLRDFLFRPERLTPEAEAKDWLPGPVLALFPLALLLRPRRVAFALLLPGLLYAPVLLAYTQYTNLRYLIPALIPLSVAGAAGLAALEARVSKRPQGALLALLVAALVLVPSAWAMTRRVREAGALGFVRGALSGDEYMRRYWETGEYYRAVEWVNANVSPATGRVLMLYDARGFYLDVPAWQDNLQNNWLLLSLTGRTRRCPRELGFTHVFVDFGVIDYFKGRGMNLAARHWDSFPEFADRCLTTAYRVRSFTVYQVRADTLPKDARGRMSPRIGSGSEPLMSVYRDGQPNTPAAQR